MTAPRRIDELIDAFLDEGRTELPDRVFDAVRSDIHATRQRVVIGPWKEPNVSSISRLATAAVLILVLGGIAWVGLTTPRGNGGPVPTPTPISSQIPFVGDGPMQPGRYAFDYLLIAGSDGLIGPTVQVTVPAGWTAFNRTAIDKDYGPSPAEAGASFVVWRIIDRYVVPCTAGTEPPALDPTPGPGVDELLQTLANQQGLAAGPLTPVTVDGYSGKFVELTVTQDIATCPAGFYPWLDKNVQGNHEVLRVYALDVKGFRLTFFARIPQRTTAADKAELESIISSITIQP